MTTVMMECGHAANATTDGEPCCAICAGIDAGWNVVAENPPDLTGRMARCYCDRDPVPSDPDRLAFFEYRGEGSDFATNGCAVCRFSKIVHQKVNPATGREGVTDHEFTPRGPHEFDAYYCGCRGWD